MPLIQSPNLVVLPSRKGERQYSASFSYDFNTDPVIPISAGGIVSTGSVFNFNSLNLGPAAANLPPFKSMQFIATFIGEGNPDNIVPGQLFVAVGGTGQIIAIPAPQVVETASIGTYTALVSGCVPIVCTSPSNIAFYKTVDSINNTTSGKVQATFFTFDLPAYVISNGGILFE